MIVHKSYLGRLLRRTTPDRVRLGYLWLCLAAYIAISAFVTACSPPEAATPTPGMDPGTATTISGYVVSGGDTTPEGLTDAPRKFVFKVERDDGSFVSVSYTAYPPRPAEVQAGKNVRLDFHSGTIQIGDYLKARGTYDKDTNTLVVANEGNYIETYPKKP